MSYAELQALSNYSFLSGASHPGELVETARALGLAAIGIADRNTLAGVVRAWSKGREIGQRVLAGARLDFADGAPGVTANVPLPFGMLLKTAAPESVSVTSRVEPIWIWRVPLLPW